jgi:hypothetical protein
MLLQTLIKIIGRPQDKLLLPQQIKKHNPASQHLLVQEEAQGHLKPKQTTKDL